MPPSHQLLNDRLTESQHQVRLEATLLATKANKSPGLLNGEISKLTIIGSNSTLPMTEAVELAERFKNHPNPHVQEITAGYRLAMSRTLVIQAEILYPAVDTFDDGTVFCDHEFHILYSEDAKQQLMGERVDSEVTRKAIAAAIDYKLGRGRLGQDASSFVPGANGLSFYITRMSSEDMRKHRLSEHSPQWVQVNNITTNPYENKAV